MEDGNDLVSIVVVTHDNWPDLELAIESALAQSWRNVEVIVVDNDSRDGTEMMVQSQYASRVTYVRQANVLDGGGYNRGIRESRGQFVQLLDGDDFIAPNKIAVQMEKFHEHPEADIVYGDARQFSGAPGRPEWSDWETKQEPDMLASLLDPAGKGAGLVPHTALFRRKVFEQAGEWDESLVGADMDYWIRAAWAGCRFVYSPGAWCFHRRRPGQMSSDLRAMVNRTTVTLEKALRYIDREPYLTLARRRLARLKYGRALTDLHLDRSQARTFLREARETDPERISFLPYSIAQVLIHVPGARRVLKNPALTSIRRGIARGMRVLD